MTLKRKVFDYLWPHRYPFLAALLQVLLINGLELLKPWPIKIVIDHVLGGLPLPWNVVSDLPPQTLLWLACVALVIVYFTLGGLNVLNNMTTIRIGQRMVADLRRELYDHLQSLSMSFYTRTHLGDLLYRVTSDTLAIQTIAMNGIFPVLSAVTLLSGMFIVLARLDWSLTVLALSVCPVLFCAIAVLNARIVAAAAHVRQRESYVYCVVQRAISSMRIVQAFTKEKEEGRRFLTASQASLDAELDLYKLQSLYSWVVNFVIAAGTALVVWVGARHVLAGVLTVGEIVVFVSYLASLYEPINRIFQTYGLVQGARAGVGRVFEILAVERDVQDGARYFSKTGCRGSVSFEGVSFGYVPGQPVLKELDLRVAAGETVAIVGLTGAGKSTLVHLLPRFYDPQLGRVTVDGVDVREFRIRSLRRQIAMVLQPPLVFPVTIRENIGYGRRGASLDEVVAAARTAGIHDFITALPQGYDTTVGEQGATLSEGQKQRLTIARAVLRRAPIWILDEPTSSVDPETEDLIMNGIGRLTAGKTAFIIAHRLSTIRQADRIVVLSRGRIVEQGSFAELQRSRGPFTSLFRAQLQIQGEKRVAYG